MKAAGFAVVVQWGNHMVYFTGFYPTEAEAQRAAMQQRRRQTKRKPKTSARPTVSVWEQKGDWLET